MINSVQSTYQQQHADFQSPTPASTTGQATAGFKQLSENTKDTVSLSADAKNQTLPGEKPMSQAEVGEVNRLKQTDQKVKAHEHSHMAAGAGLVQGGASYTYTKGPDGKNYAVGGEVKIDTSPESDPDQTIQKMQQVKRAALAPAEPSGTDRAVAARAAQVEARARMEKTKLENEEMQETTAGHQHMQGYDPSAKPIMTESITPPAMGKQINISA